MSIAQRIIHISQQTILKCIFVCTCIGLAYMKKKVYEKFSSCLEGRLILKLCFCLLTDVVITEIRKLCRINLYYFSTWIRFTQTTFSNMGGRYDSTGSCQVHALITTDE